MTRWHGIEQADRVAADGATDGARGTRRSDPAGDLAVGRRPPHGMPRDGAEDVPVPGRPIGQVDRHGVGRRPSRQEASSAALRRSRWARRGSSAVDVGQRRDRHRRAVARAAPRRPPRSSASPPRRPRARSRPDEADPTDRRSSRRWPASCVGHRAQSRTRSAACILPGSMQTPPPTIAELTLPIEGMTCASCVNRIERFLRKTAGRRERDRQPRHRDGDHPLPARRGRPRGAGRRHRVGRLRRPRTRPPATPARRRLSLAERDRADDARPANARRAACSSGASVSIAVAVGIMVLMFGPDRVARHDASSTGSRSSRRRSSRSGPGAGSTGRPGGRPGTGRRNMDTLVAVGTTRRLGLQRRRDPVAGGRRWRPARAGHLLRLLDHHHRPRPARSVARGARQGPRRPGAIRRLVGLSPTTARRGRRRRARSDVAARGRSRSATCCGSGRARRSRSTASSSRAARRVDESMLTGESMPVAKSAGRRGHRRDAQRDRQLRHARDARRARHGARPDRRARRAAQGSKAPIAAPGRPHRRGLRAARARPRRADVRRLVRRSARSRALTFALVVVHRGPRHRLPVRDGPRDADGDHGRHRPRAPRPASSSAAARRSRPPTG